MAYEYGSGWNDITELQCLLIMKKLYDKNFYDTMADLCKELEGKCKKRKFPLKYQSIRRKVSNYKSLAQINKESNHSSNTERLYEEYKNHSVKELELVIIEMQKKI